MTTHNQSGSVVVHFTRRVLFILGLVLLAPWAILLWNRAGAPGDEGGRARSYAAGASVREIPSSKGPWGELRIVRIMTEPPAESLANYLSYPKPVWQFKGYSQADFEGLLRSAALTAEQEQALKASASPSADGYSVSPPDDVVWSLSPESRTVLYGALSLFPENVFQHEPFRFRKDMESEWFTNSSVPDETLGRVRKLFYQRGKTLLFSDPHLIVPSLSSDVERVRLLKALSRQSTLMVYLHVGPDTDIPSLVSYWAPREGRAKDIKPLLESAGRIPGGLDIDITHLLPRFARKRIYTYPSAEGDKGETVFDCHWNSMNFWNDPPNDKFSDGMTVIRTLETDYEPVTDDYRFGDIILFMKSETQAIHSAVYVADNILFTKNGPSQHSPWILMLMDTLVSHYQTNVDLKIRAYRKKMPAARMPDKAAP
jgi:hypothetical protein